MSKPAVSVEFWTASMKKLEKMYGGGRVKLGKEHQGHSDLLLESLATAELAYREMIKIKSKENP